MINYGYGQNFEEPKGLAFKAGINEPVNLKSFGLVEVQTANFNGNVLDVIFEKDGDEAKLRLFPVDETKVTTRNEQTQEEAVAKAYGDLNAVVKHVVTAFEHLLPADKQGKYDEVVKAATDFESFVKLSASYLPEDYQQYSGKLAMGYNNNGYLEVPRYLWITGHFFVVDGSDKTIQLGKRITLVRPVQAAAQPSVTPATPTDW